MFKDLLVPMMRTASEPQTLAAAAEYARMFGAHLTALECVNLPIPTPGPWGLTPNSALSGVYDTIRAESRVRTDRFKELLSLQGIDFDVRQAESLFVNPDITAAEHARYADLAILGASREPGDLSVVRAYFSAVLLGSGRPVLVVPEGVSVKRPDRVVIGWRPTREATRAIHDALPLLHLAQVVDVFEVGPKGESLGDGEQPGVDIAGHLARHGLDVKVVIHDQHLEAVSSALLRHCRQVSAQLLVVGGYGHSRLREWALGGTTRELLQFADVPTLFSH